MSLRWPLWKVELDDNIFRFSVALYHCGSNALKFAQFWFVLFLLYFCILVKNDSAMMWGLT